MTRICIISYKTIADLTDAELQEQLDSSKMLVDQRQKELEFAVQKYGELLQERDRRKKGL